MAANNGGFVKRKDERARTGVVGLDSTYLIQEDPGVCKTTLALQFLLEGVALGETGLYVTLSETKDLWARRWDLVR